MHHVRRSFQRAMEEQFRDIVESATGRKVVAYMSQVHEDPDLAVEVFVLGPEEDGEQDEHAGSLTEPRVPAIEPG